MGKWTSKFKKMEEFDCSMDQLDGKIENPVMASDPRSPNSLISRTPLNECRSKSNLITKTVNLANVSTPINNDLLLIQDKRFKHLAQSFIDPRSPSEGIVRTPIVLKSTDISSIVNTPRILEEELNDEDDFQKSFEEALSKISFDDCLSEDQRTPQLQQKAVNIIETHFDCIPEQMDALQPIKPLKPLAFSNLVQLDPRSPSIGIDRTPLTFDKPERVVPSSKPIELNLMGHEELNNRRDVIVHHEAPLKEQNDDKYITKEEEEDAKETGETKEDEEGKQQKTDKSEIFIDVGQVILGTPLNVTNQPIQQVRTPLSCLGNRRRVDLNSQVTKSPLNQKSLKQPTTTTVNNFSESAKAKKKSTTTNPFETAPRKLIR